MNFYLNKPAGPEQSSVLSKYIDDHILNIEWIRYRLVFTVIDLLEIVVQN